VIASLLDDFEKETKEKVEKKFADRIKAADSLYEAALKIRAVNAAGGWDDLSKAIADYHEFVNYPFNEQKSYKTVDDIINEVKKTHTKEDSPTVIELLDSIKLAHDKQVESLQKELASKTEQCNALLRKV